MRIHGLLVLKLCLCLVVAAAVAVADTGPTLSASPGAVSFQYSPGEPAPQPVNVLVIASDGSSPVLNSVTITPTAPTPSGLFPPGGLIVNGDTISVGYDVNTLQSLLNAPGVYTAALKVDANGFDELTIPVSFVIGAPVSISAAPSSLTFSAPSGPASQPITLLSNNGAQISFVVASDSTWLSATATASYTPATLTVTVNAVNLPTGTYQGNISISPSTGGILIIPVTLIVGTNTLIANPASLSFGYTIGGTTPAPQVLQLSSLITNNTYTAQATSTGNWLLLNGVTTQISGALPASLNVTVNAASLAAGSYQGTITATDADSDTQTVTVTLVVSRLSPVANPTSLTFVAQAGSPGKAPPSQIVSISSAANASYTATATSAGGWLSISSTGGQVPAQLTVSANPGNMAAGTYTGTVQINLNAHLQNIQVTLIVSANPVLAATPGEFIENYYGGNPSLGPLSLNVGVSSGSSQSFTIGAGMPAWLQVSGTPPLNTSANLTVNVAAQTLPTGTYLAQIFLIPAATVAVPVGVPVVVPVLLTVQNATAVVPNVTSLSFSAGAGAAPQSQTVEVTASSPTAFTASAASTGNWLSVSPASGNASVVNTPLTVTADASNLAKGTYQGTVTLTTGGGVVTQISVTFSVAVPGGQVGISPSTLAFAYTQGGTLPAAQTLQITGSQSFTAAASTSSGTWLAVTPSSGTGNVSLSVSVNPASLTPGAYDGTITVIPTGGVAQTVAVTLTVSTAGTLAVPPSTLLFAYAAGNPPPAAQTVPVTSTGQPVAFTASASSSGWLSVTQSSGTTPATLTVTVNPANLGAGLYNGSIALSGGSGVAQLNINVALTVSAALPVIGGVVNAASYLEGSLAPGEIISIFGTAMGPATGVVATVDNNGLVGTTLANVTVTFNGYPAPMLYASAGQINAIVPFELAGASNASVEVVFASARSNSLTLPVVASAPGIFSADASGQGPGAMLDLSYHPVSASNPVSGGQYIQIFATGQGQTSPGGVDGLIEPSTGPWPVPLLNATVTIGGVTADTNYVGDAPGLVAGALQINALIPDGLPSGPATLVVSFGGVYNSQPGITVAIK